MNLTVHTDRGWATITGEELFSAIVNIVEAKVAEEESSRPPGSLLDDFIRDHCYAVPGEYIPFVDFYERFLQTLNRAERRAWGKQKVASALPAQYPYGAHTGNRRYIGNISWEPMKSSKPRWVQVHGRLARA